MERQPLDVSVKRCVINGQLYDLCSYEEYNIQETHSPNTAVVENMNDKNIVFPHRGRYNAQATNPGIYDAGCIDIVIKPTEYNMQQYIPTKIVEISNKNTMKEILERKDVMAKLDEPWITSPDNITQFNITEEDAPEMVCLKKALNCKNIDLDKYGPRFGKNFLNDKRRMKENSATLNIIKRYCQCTDMEAILILRDKNPDVPNPIGTEIVVSLTDNYSEIDDEE